MIKVLNIISDRNIGGAGRCVLNFLKYYDRKNFAVKVVVPKGSLLIPEIEKLHTKVIEVDGIADKSFDIAAIGKLNRIIKRENPDVVHTHGTLTGRLCGRLCGKKVVYTRHSVFPVSPKIKKGLGRLLNKVVNEALADGIIAVAEAAKENLTDGGIAPARVQVILNGVEAVTAISGEERQQEREKFCLQSDDFVMGMLARLEAVKGHCYLIEAVDMLRKKGRPVKALIAGVGPEEEKLRAMVIEKGLQEAVQFVGFVTDIPRFLSILDLQINASYGTEATSLSLLEGMSMGLPAIVSRYGGNPGVITSGENGYLFESRQSSELAKYIEKLMDEPEIYKKMQNKAKQIYLEKFTAKTYAQNIQAVYERVFNGKVR